MRYGKRKKGYRKEAVHTCCAPCCSPCCWTSISFSWATTFASSSRMRASGRPMRRAEVVTTQMKFPANFVVPLKKDAVFETFETRE